MRKLLLLLFKRQVASDSLQLHDCSAPGFSVLHSPGVCSYSCLLSQSCHPTISSSVTSSSSCPQSSLASGSFLMSWFLAKDLEVQLQHQSVQWIFRVDFLRIDWFDLLAVKGTLKSLLQLHTLKASILPGSAFFTVQLSKPCMTTGKTIASTIWTFIGRVMSLPFNTLSRFVIAFLPRSKHLLISWLQSPSTVIFRAQEEEICHYFHFFPPLLVMK